MPEIIKENYNPSPYLASVGGSRIELEKMREKQKVVYERNLRLAQTKYEMELAEA